MNLRFIPIVGLMLSALCACHDKDPQPTPGVSWELAQLRRQTIDSVRYHLNFNIPAQATAPVAGTERITFYLKERQSVLLDFRNDPSHIEVITVNGIDIGPQLENEHILISSRHLRTGTNEVVVQFTPGSQALNRHDDYLYTLLVPDRARTLFPCFDQPDLKAHFTLQLQVPKSWQAVSNTQALQTTAVNDSVQCIDFATTEPLSTYLFSFVAGRFERADYDNGEHRFSAYHRETDPAKVAQLDSIFPLVAHALQWMEQYTGVHYPFAKYDFVIMPDFQFGGMEHTGATLYNDTRMFLNAHATTDEVLARYELIAHETAHLWFGDYVTMPWFNDVWTKEVFANYFAAEMSRAAFPNVNHDILWLQNYQAGALSEDRTKGATAISQHLDNLNHAGLIYSNIIYDKAPIMMRKLVEQMGASKFQEGLRTYVQRYGYGNASWEDLVDILNPITAVNVEQFSQNWVHAAGMPTLTFMVEGDELTVHQADPYERGVTWPQSFNVTAKRLNLPDTILTIQMQQLPETYITLPPHTTLVIPNTDGRAYGLLIPDEATIEYMVSHWHEEADETAREAGIMLLYELYQSLILDSNRFKEAVITGLHSETNPLILSTLSRYASALMLNALPQADTQLESELWTLSQKHPSAGCRLQVLRALIAYSNSEIITRQIYDLWQQQNCDLLSERDYTNMAYELAIRMPDRTDKILKEQHYRLDNPDRLRLFECIAPSVSSSQEERDAAFQHLLDLSHSSLEAWVPTALYYLNHPLRQYEAVKYIYPSLLALSDVQRNSDIFFPSSWCYSLLKGHRSAAAYQQLCNFLDENPELSPLLVSKIEHAAFGLERMREEGNSLRSSEE